MFHFNLHHITLILIGYLSNISWCSPLPFGLLSSQVSGNGITFSHVELPICKVWLQVQHWFKEEIHTRISLILNEREKKSPTEQCKNDQNRKKKIRKLWHSEISKFFGKHFLTSPYEYSNEQVDDVIPSQFCIYFIYRNDKNLIFQL